MKSKIQREVISLMKNLKLVFGLASDLTSADSDPLERSRVQISSGESDVRKVF